MPTLAAAGAPLATASVCPCAPLKPYPAKTLQPLRPGLPRSCCASLSLPVSRRRGSCCRPRRPAAWTYPRSLASRPATSSPCAGEQRAVAGPSWDCCQLGAAGTMHQQFWYPLPDVLAHASLPAPAVDTPCCCALPIPFAAAATRRRQRGSRAARRMRSDGLHMDICERGRNMGTCAGLAAPACPTVAAQRCHAAALRMHWYSLVL